MWPWKKKVRKKLSRDVVFNLWHTWASVQCLEGGESPGEAASTFVSIFSTIGIDLQKELDIDPEELTLSAMELIRPE